jgi:hypothetical protein
LQRSLLIVALLGGNAVAQPAPDAPPDPVPEPPPAETSPAPTPAPVQQPTPPAPVAVQPAPPPREEPELTEAEQIQLANYASSSVRVGGYIQTQYRKREDSGFGSDTDGFRARAIRITARGDTRAGNLELSAFLETELQPQFDLLDGFGTASRPFKDHARVTVDVGQMRVPVSRQNMLSDANLAFPDKAFIASISPIRDLGMKVTFDLPRPDGERRSRRRKSLRVPGVRLIGGVFNGEGTNVIENINQKYMWTGRAEVTVFGEERHLSESAFEGQFLTLAGSYARNKRNEGNRLDRQSWVGFDISGAYKGISGSFEYLEVRHVQTSLNEEMDDPNTFDFHANGFNAQLCYMLPFKLAPWKQARLELGGRLEEIDRNDTVPIATPNDPNQSVRAITAIASYYLRMHSFKLQLAYSHFKELENQTAAGAEARFKNDQLLLQATYRLE